MIALGPKGRDGAVALLERGRRQKRKPQWLDNTVPYLKGTALLPRALPHYSSHREPFEKTSDKPWKICW